jgi:hypothetical protein
LAVNVSFTSIPTCPSEKSASPVAASDEPMPSPLACPTL